MCKRYFEGRNYGKTGRGSREIVVTECLRVEAALRRERKVGRCSTEGNIFVKESWLKANVNLFTTME